MRNLVIITTDDQGLQAGCYGDAHASTPNMECPRSGGGLIHPCLHHASLLQFLPGLSLDYFDPHRPYDAGSNQTKGLPEKPYHPGDVPPLPDLGIDGPPARMEAAAYYNSVRRMDRGLGMLFDTFKAHGYWDNH